MPNETISTKTESKSIKHPFTPIEREDLGKGLALCVGSLRGLLAEFDQVKKDYKAKESTHEAKIDLLSTNLCNGFEMRTVRCSVVYRPKDKKKDYYLEGHTNGDEPVLIEDMLPEDYQAELLAAESKFDLSERIQLFPPTETDNGALIVGKFGKHWYSALRITVGRLKLEERLDSEQQGFRQRWDAITHAAKRAEKWYKKEFKEQGQGFQEPLLTAIEPHREREE